MLALTLGYYLKSEQQNEVLEQFARQDLSLLSRYIEVFTNLSRHHQEIYQLFNDASSQIVDEGILYDRGVAILDSIYQSTQYMEELVRTTPTVNATIQIEESSQILTKIIAYRHSAISSIENTTVSISEAPKYLNQANEHFGYLHEHFANTLDLVRDAIKQRTTRHLIETRKLTLYLSVAGVISAILLVIFSFLISGFMSKRISRSINRLYDLNEESTLNRSNSGDELERLQYAVEVFEKFTTTIRQQEQELVRGNRELQNKIAEKQKQEELLQQTTENLEKRVQERTASLLGINDELEREVKQRREAEQSLRIYQEIIFNTDEAIIVTEPDATIIEVNPAYENHTGYTRKELIGKKPSIVQSGFHDRNFYRTMWLSINMQGQWTGEVWNRKKNGEIFPLWVTINAIYDENKRIQYLIGLYRDISEIKKAEARLEQLAFYDALTSLPNRTLFNEKLAQELASAKRHQEKVALFFLDLDNFKDINDTMGHNMGDKLLIEVSRRLNNVLRDTDLIARISGDEFTIAITQLNDTGYAQQVAHRLLETVSIPYTINDHIMRIGISIGIAIYPDHSDNIETLRKYSDMAMYKAKSKGKNQFRIFSPELQMNREQRVNLETYLLDALETNAFHLTYQPIVDLTTGHIISCEALLRWVHQGQPISPEQFIPIAEESGLINQIDKWVLRTACKACVQWNSQLPSPISLHINLSAKFFQQKDTAQFIQDLLNEFQLDGSHLCFEITETAVINDSKATKKTIDRMKKLGIEVAMDDFGTGFSSLNYLTQFELDEIKIDRSFVLNLENEPANQAVVDTVIELAKRLDIDVVAEGIETQQQYEHLRKAGCHFGQGYYFSYPLLENDLIEIVIKDQSDSSNVFDIHDGNPSKK